MRYACLIYDNETEMNAAMEKDGDAIMGASFSFTDDSQKSGHYPAGEALQPVATATTLRIRNGKLHTTDGPFGNPSVAYPGAFIATRAFDTLPAPADLVTIAGDLNSATFSLTAELGMDQARIFTVPVPEPSSAVLLAVGAGVLASIRRWRGHRRTGSS